MRAFIQYILSFSLIINLANASTNLQKVLKDGDQFYDERESLDKAYQALALYEKYLDTHPDSIDALWRASMANYYVGHLLQEEKKRIERYKKGVKQGELCVKLSNNKVVECYFWLATNTALLKKEYGIFSLAFGIGSIIKIFDKALKIDSKYAGSGPYRMLSLLYYKAPGFLGGDRKKAYSYILKAMEQSPKESLNYYFYIKFLKDDGEAEKALEVAKKFTEAATPADFTYFESKTAYKNILHFLKTKELPKKD